MYIFIIIIPIILIIIYLIIKKYNFNKKISYIYNIPDSYIIDFYTNIDSYRLGDGFYFTEDINRWKEHNNDIYGKYNKSLNYILKLYPDSILSKYLIKSNFKQKKYNIIKNIILSKFIKDYTINPYISCFLHLRIGDKIELDFKNNFPKYIKEKLFYFNKIINKLKKNNIQNIYIFAGSHVKLESFKNSTLYLYNIINLFKKKNFNIILNIKLHPDNDLLKSLNFIHFLGDNTNSQYFRFITDINRKINSNIIIY